MTDQDARETPWQEMAAVLDELEADAALLEPPAFAARQDALEQLEVMVWAPLQEFAAAEPVAGASALARPGGQGRALKRRADALRRRLEAADERLYGALRGKIAAGTHDRAALWRQMSDYVGRGPQRPWIEDPMGYDALDAFVCGLFEIDEPPAETLAREAEMVYYQPTPARVVLRLIEWAGIGPGDVFFDLGAGLGQVCLLVALLTGAESRGIEIEPVYVAYARRRAQQLGLERAIFEACDARAADYSAGTVFFLYTPFTGRLMADVLARLRAAAAGRVIRVGAYGPCTATLAHQSWLHPLRGRRDDANAPMVWESRP